MTAPTRKRSMPRVLNAPDVHYEGPATFTHRTICGINHTGFPYTRKPVTCPLCLALVRWVHQHRREATDR